MPKIKIGVKDKTADLLASLRKLSKQQVYVGIPEATSTDRKQALETLAATGQYKNLRAGKKKRARIATLATENVTNAGLLFIHTKGSELRGIPPRPVVEPAIEANRVAIDAELQAAAKDVLDGKDPTRNLKRAGIAGQNAARKWFTDPRNGWAPNAAGTIAQKGSDRPLIDTGAMRQAITYVVKEDQ